VLSFAGLWDRWKNPETGERIASCTIIVTDANELTRSIHDRMPVVLDQADIGRWLTGEAGTELLRPAGEDRLRMWTVSRRVNKTGTGDDDPTILDEVAAWCLYLRSRSGGGRRKPRRAGAEPPDRRRSARSGLWLLGSPAFMGDDNDVKSETEQ
jgi:hypothetical protein